MKRWTVHAFEGTSCCSADGMANILEVFRQHRKGPVCVVVSPKSDIPPALLSLVDQAIVREESLWGTMESLSQQMSGLADELVPPDYRQDLEAAIREDFQNIEDILRAVWLVRDSSPRTREYISGLGAVWIAQVFHSRLKAEGYSVQWLDTRKIISVQPQDYGIEVQYEDTSRALGEVFDQDSNDDFLVVTGGLGKTLEGAATSLGKDGAELTATIFGNLLDAEKITLFRSVDGVMTADPSKVPGSEVIPELTYQEATELAYFGAEVLHPPAMTPALMKNIPLSIRNINHPEAPGTVISSKAEFSTDKPVKGFSIVNEVSLLNIEGAGMIGVPGISSRLFASLNRQGISVILISQASSEHSICCAVPSHQARSAREIAREAFAAELESYRINSIEVEEECAILLRSS